MFSLLKPCWPLLLLNLAGNPRAHCKGSEKKQLTSPIWSALYSELQTVKRKPLYAAFCLLLFYSSSCLLRPQAGQNSFLPSIASQLHLFYTTYNAKQPHYKLPFYIVLANFPAASAIDANTPTHTHSATDTRELPAGRGARAAEVGVRGAAQARGRPQQHSARPGGVERKEERGPEPEA